MKMYSTAEWPCCLIARFGLYPKNEVPLEVTEDVRDGVMWILDHHLTETQRIVLEMKERDLISFSKIGEALNLSRDVASLRHQKAIRRFTQYYQYCHKGLKGATEFYFGPSTENWTVLPDGTIKEAGEDDIERWGNVPVSFLFPTNRHPKSDVRWRNERDYLIDFLIQSGGFASVGDFLAACSLDLARLRSREPECFARVIYATEIRGLTIRNLEDIDTHAFFLPLSRFFGDATTVKFRSVGIISIQDLVSYAEDYDTILGISGIGVNTACELVAILHAFGISIPGTPAESIEIGQARRAKKAEAKATAQKKTVSNHVWLRSLPEKDFSAFLCSRSWPEDPVACEEWLKAPHSTEG